MNLQSVSVDRLKFLRSKALGSTWIFLAMFLSGNIIAAEETVHTESKGTSNFTSSENWLLGSWFDFYSDCKRPAYNFYKNKLIEKTDVDGDPAVFTSKVTEYTVQGDSVLIKFKDEHTMRPWRGALDLVRVRMLENNKAEFVHPRPSAVNLQITKCPTQSPTQKSRMKGDK